VLINESAKLQINMLEIKKAQDYILRFLLLFIVQI